MKRRRKGDRIYINYIWHLINASFKQDAKLTISTISQNKIMNNTGEFNVSLYDRVTPELHRGVLTTNQSQLHTAVNMRQNQPN